jgi:hypothetical protein
VADAAETTSTAQSKPPSSPTPVTLSNAPLAGAPVSTAGVSDAELQALRPRRGRAVLALGLAGAAVVAGYVAIASNPEPHRPPAVGAPTPSIPPQVAVPPDAQVSAEAPSAAPTEAPTAAPTEAPTAAPTPAPAGASPEPAASSAPSGMTRVHIISQPPGARMFWRGKEVGTTPFTLEMPAGDRRSFELGLPGHVTRRLVVDGSTSEISVGLRPEGAAPNAPSSSR